jgi:hypothetical protein
MRDAGGNRPRSNNRLTFQTGKLYFFAISPTVSMALILIVTKPVKLGVSEPESLRA